MAKLAIDGYQCEIECDEHRHRMHGNGGPSASVMTRFQRQHCPVPQRVKYASRSCRGPRSCRVPCTAVPIPPADQARCCVHAWVCLCVHSLQKQEAVLAIHKLRPRGWLMGSWPARARTDIAMRPATGVLSRAASECGAGAFRRRVTISSIAARNLKFKLRAWLLGLRSASRQVL